MRTAVVINTTTTRYQGKYHVYFSVSMPGKPEDPGPNPQSCDIDDRILSSTPGAEPPRDARDSGSARSHSTHLETSSSDRP